MLVTSSDCLKASLHQSPHTRHLLCFGISVSSHPMGYVLNHLEISELALRDSVAKCRTVKKNFFHAEGNLWQGKTSSGLWVSHIISVFLGRTVPS